MTPKGASAGAGAGMVHGRYRKREFADFFVSCQHFTTGATRLREPHGTQHLRRLAEDAACGVRARDWPIFFDTPIDVRNQNLCQACARGLGLRA